MATFYLVRHGETDMIGRALAGRTPGVHLNAGGKSQAAALADLLAKRPVNRIVSSPLERARETAAPLAAKLGLEVSVHEDLTELDFGEWTGQPISSLEGVETWKQWNHFRSAGRAPGGESMIEVQARMVRVIQSLQAQHPAEHIALFSHADPIRAALVYWLGMPLDALLRLTVQLGSASVVKLNGWGATLEAFNLAPESSC